MTWLAFDARICREPKSYDLYLSSNLALCDLCLQQIKMLFTFIYSLMYAESLIENIIYTALDL